MSLVCFCITRICFTGFCFQAIPENGFFVCFLGIGEMGGRLPDEASSVACHLIFFHEALFLLPEDAKYKNMGGGLRGRLPMLLSCAYLLSRSAASSCD